MVWSSHTNQLHWFVWDDIIFKIASLTFITLVHHSPSCLHFLLVILLWNQILNADLFSFQLHQYGIPFLFPFVNLLLSLPLATNWKLIFFLHEVSSNRCFTDFWTCYVPDLYSNWNFWPFCLGGPGKLNCFCLRGFPDTVLRQRNGRETCWLIDWLPSRASNPSLSATRSLRSSYQNQLVIPRMDSANCRCSYQYAVPYFCNSLPLSIRTLTSYLTFRSMFLLHASSQKVLNSLKSISPLTWVSWK